MTFLEALKKIYMPVDPNIQAQQQYYTPLTGMNGNQHPFNDGDRVVLFSVDTQLYRPSQAHPVWGYEQQYIAGIVTAHNHLLVRIRWDNGFEETYDTRRTHIKLYNEAMAQKKPKKITLDSAKLDKLVIADAVKEEIVAVLQQHKNHDKLFGEWGLGEIIEYGRGMTFLFYGTPGTGKTWGATCIAKALGTELLVISAAEIQSSEPGGANRAIQQAFKEAKSSGKVIFLDECDSLIASRNDLGMVLAGEVNTLLTEIEKFEGVAILATNRIEHMDEALERRISLIVEFPKPDYENRKKIWSKLLPEKLPLENDVDVEVLAKPELTGGQIKNVVLQAARMALAGECKKVGKKHFDLAIARVQKSKNLMGSASRYRQGVVKDDFGSGVDKTKSDDFKKFLTEEKEDDNN